MELGGIKFIIPDEDNYIDFGAIELKIKTIARRQYCKICDSLSKKYSITKTSGFFLSAQIHYFIVQSINQAINQSSNGLSL